MTVPSAAFTWIVKRALGTAEPDIASRVDDTLISTYTWEDHLATLRAVFNKLRDSNLPVNFAKCTYTASHRELLGMVVDSTQVRPSPSIIEALTELPRPPTNVEELRAFAGMIGYLCEDVEKHSIVAALLAGLLVRRVWVQASEETTH